MRLLKKKFYLRAALCICIALSIILVSVVSSCSVINFLSYKSLWRVSDFNKCFYYEIYEIEITHVMYDKKIVFSDEELIYRTTEVFSNLMVKRDLFQQIYAGGYEINIRVRERKLSETEYLLGEYSIYTIADTIEIDGIIYDTMTPLWPQLDLIFKEAENRQ